MENNIKLVKLVYPLDAQNMALSEMHRMSLMVDDEYLAKALELAQGNPEQFRAALYLLHAELTIKTREPK
jgi:hypothetical protein